MLKRSLTRSAVLNEVPRSLVRYQRSLWGMEGCQGCWDGFRGYWRASNPETILSFHCHNNHKLWFGCLSSMWKYSPDTTFPLWQWPTFLSLLSRFTAPLTRRAVSSSSAESEPLLELLYLSTVFPVVLSSVGLGSCVVLMHRHSPPRVDSGQLAELSS